MGHAVLAGRTWAFMGDKESRGFPGRGNRFGRKEGARERVGFSPWLWWGGGRRWGAGAAGGPSTLLLADPHAGLHPCPPAVCGGGWPCAGQ